MTTAGIGPNIASPEAHVLRGPRVVAHPQAGVGQAVAQVARHDGPRVVGVDGQERVAAGGHRDLLEQAREVRRRPVSPITDSPNGSDSTTAVTNPASPVVRIRIGRAGAAPRRRDRRPATARGGWSRPRRAG